MKTFERYRQVLLTYIDRPAFRVLLLATLFGVSGYYGLNRFREGYYGLNWFRDHSVAYNLLGVFFFADFLAFFAPFVVLILFTILQISHLRAQLAEASAHVLPRYRSAHLNVGAAVFLLAAMVASACVLGLDRLHFSYSYHADPLGTFALVLGLMTLTAWWASFRSPWFSGLMIPLVLLAMHNLRIESWVRSMLHYAWVPAWERDLSVLAFDADALALLFLRFAWMSSERSRGGRSRPTRESTARPHVPITATILRAAHLRAGVLPPGAAWVVAGALFVLLSLVTVIVHPNASDFLRSVVLATVIPGVVVSASWIQRWRNIAYESLYPGRRAAFIRELALANALDLAEFWIATMLAALVPVLIWNGSQFASPLVPVIVAASAGMQVLVFGGIFLSAISRSILPYATVMFLAATFIPLAFAWGDKPTLSPHGLILVSVIEMAGGVLLAVYAYTAWRKVDWLEQRA